MSLFKKPLTLKDTEGEIRQYQGRVIVVAVLIGILLSVLAVRLVYLQVFQHYYYLTLSKQNLLSVAPIDPSRGLIFDRNGVLLAENIPVFSLDVIPAKVPHLKKTLKVLSKLMNLSSDEIDVFEDQLTQNRKYNSIPLKVKLTDQEIATFAVNRYRFPGVFINAHMVRYYPYKDLLAPVLGYVGRINAQEFAKVDQNNYESNDYIGKTGIEKYNESLLHGNVGIQQIETSATGNVVRSLQNKPPTAGQNLTLSLDIKLQEKVADILKDQNGGAVILDARNGEVLTMVSRPSFDPNLFVMGISQKEYKKLSDDPDKPLFNRILQGEFPSGSTIKPFLGLGALYDGTITPDKEIYDPGFFKLPNHPHIYHDDNRGTHKGGHGMVNLEKAIIVSCDTYYFLLAYHMGIDKIDAALQRFGFGAPTGIDTFTERKGLVPSDAWSRRVHHHSWYGGDTISLGIGQSYFLTTPLQLANALMRLINKGHGFQPHFLMKSETPLGVVTPNPLKPMGVIQYPDSYWNLMIKALGEVVSDPRGTGYLTGHTAKYTYGGKSGTAQVFTLKGNQSDKANLLPKNMRDHSWFMAFAPAVDPKIVLVVFLEHGGQANGQKYARRILDAYFGADVEEKKKEVKKVAEKDDADDDGDDSDDD
jgi:penicillin-binding protein 2